MTRSGKRSVKGGKRHFTNPDAEDQAKVKEDKELEWERSRASRYGGEEDGDSDEETSSGSGGDEESSDSSGSEEETVAPKPKGTESIVEISNPNRAPPKFKKVSNLNDNGQDESATKSNKTKPTMTRRQREEIEKERAAQRYRKMHEAGQTDEARADLARLAIVRKQREEAERKKLEESKAKEEAIKAAADARKAATSSLLSSDSSTQQQSGSSKSGGRKSKKK